MADQDPAIGATKGAQVNSGEVLQEEVRITSKVPYGINK
jgi:hypothetical protein